MPIFEIGVKKNNDAGNSRQIKQLYYGRQRNHGLAAPQWGRMGLSGLVYLFGCELSGRISGAELRENSQPEGDE